MRRRTVPAWAWVLGVLALLIVLFVLLQLPDQTTGPSDSGDNRIGLGETVKGLIHADGPETWAYTGNPDVVDITVEGGPHDNFLLLLSEPDGSKETAYVDFLGQGQGEILTFVAIEPGYQIVIDDLNNDGAEYMLTIRPSEASQIHLGETVQDTLIGANPGAWVYQSAPAVVNVILQLDRKDSGLIIIMTEDGRQLAYADTANNVNEIRIDDFQLNGGETILVRDASNEGADYMLTVE